MTDKTLPSICFVGLENLPVLAEEYNGHGIGGEQVQQTLMAIALARRGYKVSMVVGDYGQQDGAAWSGVLTHKAYSPSEGIPVLRFLHPRLTKLWSALRRANADVYYVSCAGMHVGLVSYFAKKYGRRVVFRVAHDSDCEPDKLLIRFWRDKKLYEYGLSNVDRILVQSEHQKELMQRNYGHGSAIASMLVESCPSPKCYLERDIDVLWVNNIRHFKRPDLILDLADALPDVRFVIVGGPVAGDEALYDAVRERALKLQNVLFMGRVPYHQVNDYYMRAKVFVNTSDSEGFPNSFLQSWVRGTPVVSFFDPDEVISRKGLGCRAASLIQMQRFIEDYLAGELQWRAASERCLSHMREQYDEESILGPYVEAFCSNSGNRSRT